VAAQGSGQVGELAAACANPAGARIPAPLAGARAPLAELWRDLERRIAARDRQILDCATFRHLLTLPGFGPVLASAMAAIAGPEPLASRFMRFCANAGGGRSCRMAHRRPEVAHRRPEVAHEWRKNAPLWFALSGCAHVSRRLISLVPKVRYEIIV
jgi:transposase